MATIIVRRLDEAVVSRLKRRAADNNRSLESEIRDILERSAEDEMKEKVRKFRDLSNELRQHTKDQSQSSSHVLIREDRDSGHRDKGYGTD